MNVKQKIEKLATERNSPCVTISLNTHRTHPDNLVDEIELKNLLKEAEERVLENYGKRQVGPLLDKMKTLPGEINRNYLLDSLQIFLSNDTEEIIKLSVSAPENRVLVDDSFNINALIKAYNRTDEYLILLLSQGGVHLYKTLNDRVEEEIKNKDFPFAESPYYETEKVRISDSKHMDNLVREFFNNVDKALVKVYNGTGLQTIVISTEDNYSRYMRIADIPEMYIGHAAIDYNKTETHHLAGQAWKIIQDIQRESRTEAIAEMKEAVSQHRVLTDLQEIYQAAIDGNGEMLIACEDFVQPVLMKDDRTFELTGDISNPEVIDDITGVIAWEVLSKGGRIVFTRQEQLTELGDIVLKTRY